MTEKEITELTRQLKQRFFMMRNGMVGDQMRRAGVDYRINFGLNLPQIVEIARDFPVDRDLARSLWHNTTTRESMLIAPMLFPAEEMTREEALRWMAEAPTVETVDILCHRLLRRLPFAASLPEKMLGADIDRQLSRYAALRLMFNTLNDENAPRFLELARNEATAGGDTAPVAQMLVDEIEWRLSS